LKRQIKEKKKQREFLLPLYIYYYRFGGGGGRSDWDLREEREIAFSDLQATKGRGAFTPRFWKRRQAGKRDVLRYTCRRGKFAPLSDAKGRRGVSRRGEVHCRLLLWELLKGEELDPGCFLPLYAGGERGKRKLLAAGKTFVIYACRDSRTGSWREKGGGGGNKSQGEGNQQLSES